MKALINADELANDVAGAEALLDRHQEHKVNLHFLQLVLRNMSLRDRMCLLIWLRYADSLVIGKSIVRLFLNIERWPNVQMFVITFGQGEIDAHEDSFKATDEAGQALLNTGHYASEEVKEKVETILEHTIVFHSNTVSERQCIDNVCFWM